VSAVSLRNRVDPVWEASTSWSSQSLEGYPSWAAWSHGCKGQPDKMCTEPRCGGGQPKSAGQPVATGSQCSQPDEAGTPKASGDQHEPWQRGEPVRLSHRPVGHPAIAASLQPPSVGTTRQLVRGEPASLWSTQRSIAILARAAKVGITRCPSAWWVGGEPDGRGTNPQVTARGGEPYLYRPTQGCKATRAEPGASRSTQNGKATRAEPGHRRSTHSGLATRVKPVTLRSTRGVGAARAEPRPLRSTHCIPATRGEPVLGRSTQGHGGKRAEPFERRPTHRRQATLPEPSLQRPTRAVVAPLAQPVFPRPTRPEGARGASRGQVNPRPFSNARGSRGSTGQPIFGEQRARSQNFPGLPRVFGDRHSKPHITRSTHRRGAPVQEPSRKGQPLGLGTAQALPAQGNPRGRAMRLKDNPREESTQGQSQKRLGQPSFGQLPPACYGRSTHVIGSHGGRHG
jgi:hypothetical protein